MNRSIKKSILGVTIALTLTVSVSASANGNFIIGTESFIGDGHLLKVHGDHSAAISGERNTASGDYSVVAGGFKNQIGSEPNDWAPLVRTDYGTISGGSSNYLSNALNGTIGGGHGNSIYDASFATVSGGIFNEANHDKSTIAGGGFNLAAGDFAAIGGGMGNHATNTSSVIAGGEDNLTVGPYSAISGGRRGIASGSDASILGGYKNFASGPVATVAGGTTNRAGGTASFAAGSFAHVRDSSEVGKRDDTDLIGDYGTFVWADASSKTDFISNGANQFLVRANGGFALNSTPINPDVEMTITENINTTKPGNKEANLFLQQRNNAGNGILLSAVLSSGKGNDAWFTIDQYDGTNLTNRLTINDKGDISVSAEAYKPGGGAWANPSDARLKTNVQPLDHALDQVLALRGVTFEYKNPDQNLHPAGTQVGFIAQQVETVFPNWIGHTPDGYLTVGPKGFEALTVEALRELKTTHEAELSRMQEKFDTQEQELTELRHQVTALIAAGHQ